MARRRRSDHELTAAQVDALADERFPQPEWCPADDDDWNSHVGRFKAQRAQRRAFAAEHGYNLLDLFYARYPRASTRSADYPVKPEET